MTSFAYYALALLVIYMLEKFLILAWWKPRKLQRHFMEQGINGPRYKPLIGSLGELAAIYRKHNAALPPSRGSPLRTVLQHALPHLEIWREKYGRVLLYWYSTSPRLSITDPDLIKEMGNKPKMFDQCIQHPLIFQLIGNSIVSMGGETWAAQRKILNPLFLQESLKGLPGITISAIERRMERWSGLMGSNEWEMDALREFEYISQYIVARLIFGDNVEEGLAIAQVQSEQIVIASQTVNTFYIPGTRFLPTPLNRRSKRLRRDVERRFYDLIEKRKCNSPIQIQDDWLTLMLQSNTMSRQQIVDECCLILAAGSQTTNILLAWACILLSIHTEWQDRAREEIRRVVKDCRRPSPEILAQLKILNMIIYETLRLYPSFPYTMKKLIENMRVGSLMIPAGTEIEVPIVAVHHDPKLWGDNANQFDPSRFAGGVSNAAKHPMAFMPFMHGSRMCIGSNFGLIEARIALAMVLQSFTLSPSPKYKHDPVVGITLAPGTGAQVIIRSI